jgi:hypothetical protein
MHFTPRGFSAMVTPRNRTISANTLFHFTSGMNVLESILINEFYPRYSREALSFHPKIPEKETAVPMVSFCDIPLSEARDHADRYGCYAIGMKKEWGLENKVTPVVYTHRNSPLPSAMLSLFNKVSTLDEGSREFWSGPVLTLSVYFKDYEGRCWRNGSYLPNVRFYDEREWRYVPTPEQLKNVGCEPKTVMVEEEFSDKLFLGKENRKLEGCKLVFTPDDIRYLIVDKEKEILQFIDRLRDAKSPKYSDRTIELLLTRIMSMERIREDF